MRGTFRRSVSSKGIFRRSGHAQPNEGSETLQDKTRLALEKFDDDGGIGWCKRALKTSVQQGENSAQVAVEGQTGPKRGGENREGLLT